MGKKDRGNGLCSGFSIASLVFSIMGFLTGWLAFGVLLDFLGIVLGVIAVIVGRKKNASCGLAIAGIIIGVLGAGLMFMIAYFPAIWQYFNPPTPMELPWEH